MARHFGVRTYRQTITLANTPQPLLTQTQISAGHSPFTEAIKVSVDPAGTGKWTVGDSDVSVNTDNATDGFPNDAGDFVTYGIDPKVAAMPSEFDLREIYIVGTVAGDEFYVEYVAKVD